MSIQQQSCIEAMKQALEALCNITNYEGLADARQTLRQAIAEAEKQEPAMRIEYWSSADSDRYIANMIPWERLPIGTLLYTSPPQRPVAEPHKWVGLTDEEIDLIDAEIAKSGYCQMKFARSIEAKLKAKNERKEKNT